MFHTMICIKWQYEHGTWSGVIGPVPEPYQAGDNEHEDTVVDEHIRRVRE